MCKILILTAGYGEGHNSAARALKAAFDEQAGVEAELVDLFALRAPRFNNLSRRGYVKLINTAPKLWSGIYRWLDPEFEATLKTFQDRFEATRTEEGSVMATALAYVITDLRTSRRGAILEEFRTSARIMDLFKQGVEELGVTIRGGP